MKIKRKKNSEIKNKSRGSIWYKLLEDMRKV